jgi:hypothetical protein
MFQRDGQRFLVGNEVVQERRRAGSVDDQITEEGVGDPRKLSHVITRLLATVRGLERIQRKPFQDFAITPAGSGTISVNHRFGSDVRWYLVDWTGAAAPNLRRSSSTTADVLVLDSGAAGAGILRVEAV